MRNKKRSTDHQAVAARARKRPGRWVRATVYPSRYNAVSAARCVRIAERPAYAPAGSYEAEHRPYGMGTALYVRWLGEPGEGP